MFNRFPIAVSWRNLIHRLQDPSPQAQQLTFSPSGRSLCNQRVSLVECRSEIRDGGPHELGNKPGEKLFRQ